VAAKGYSNGKLRDSSSAVYHSGAANVMRLKAFGLRRLPAVAGCNRDGAWKKSGECSTPEVYSSR
jgi:hypothetical protein